MGVSRISRERFPKQWDRWILMPRLQVEIAESNAQLAIVRVLVDHILERRHLLRIQDTARGRRQRRGGFTRAPQGFRAGGQRSAARSLGNTLEDEIPQEQPEHQAAYEENGVVLSHGPSEPASLSVPGGGRQPSCIS